MKTQTQTLAFTTAALLKSSLPFMLLGLLCTAIGAAALLTPAIRAHELLLIKSLLVFVLLLALPLAWFSLRLLLDAQVMQHWAQNNSEPTSEDFDRRLAEFDQSLVALGMLKKSQPRDLITRARGCIRLLKQLLTLVAVQWMLCILALACWGL